MTDRAAMATAFLNTTAWAKALRGPLAGDASNRRYERLLDEATGKTAVLMDAPPQKGEDVRPFLRIARHLSGLGLSAPAILAEDADNGFLLLEDLGDGLFARVIPKAPASESSLYEAATDVLVALHKAPLPQNIAPYSPAFMAEMAALAFDWYLTGTLGAAPSLRDQFKDTFQEILSAHAGESTVLIQRDYHAENLLWLPDRSGPARVGLLDFQDAMSGHPAYDLVSLMQDARRDVPPEIETAMIERYIAATGSNATLFKTAYCVLGTQRNLRILGVFARLAMRDSKTHYIHLIPRVWAHLMRDLKHPALLPVADLLLNALPEPSPEILNALRSKCTALQRP